MHPLPPVKLQHILATEEPEQYCLIDVRTKGEFHEEHIPGAVSIPFSSFKKQAEDLAKYPLVCVYSSRTTRAKKAASILASIHEGDIRYLTGGFKERKEQIGDVVGSHAKLSISQQVYLGSGILSLFFVIAGLTVSGYFFLCFFFVQGLLLAGGFGEESLLAKLTGYLPWNQPPSTYEQTQRNLGNGVYIQQFFNEQIDAYSYALWSDHAMMIIDPIKDTSMYTDFAKKQKAKITGVLLTHTHTDFLAGWADIVAHTGAKVYCNEKMHAKFLHEPLTEDSLIYLGDIRLSFLSAPGHTDDSGVFVLKDQKGKELAAFVGDIFSFQGLEEGSESQTREDRVAQMYVGIQTVMQLSDTVILFATHRSDTTAVFSVADQRYTKNALGKITAAAYTTLFQKKQGLVPPYYRYTFHANKEISLPSVLCREKVHFSPKGVGINWQKYPVIDTRDRKTATKYPLGPSVCIPYSSTFIQNLGSVLEPGQQRWSIVQTRNQATHIMHDSMLIGYDTTLMGIRCVDDQMMDRMSPSIAWVREQKSAIFFLSLTSTDPLAEFWQKYPSIPGDKYICIRSEDDDASYIVRSILIREKKQFPCYVCNEEEKKILGT